MMREINMESKILSTCLVLMKKKIALKIIKKRNEGI
jgi:hypothetical protein